MNTLYDVKKKVRELCGDPQGQWLTDDTLVPLINQVYEQQVSRLAATCSPYITRVVEVPNVAVGKTSLQDFQQGGGLLKGLVKPRTVSTKIAGTPAGAYRELFEYDVLPRISALGNGAYGTVGRPGFEWRSFVIWLTPFSQAIDIEVRGDFMPPPLIQDEDALVIHPNMGHATAYEAASLAAATVGDGAWEQNYGAKGSACLIEISAQLVRQQQKLTFRAGRMNRRR